MKTLIEEKIVFISDYAKERTVEWLKSSQSEGMFDGHAEQTMDFETLSNEEVAYYFTEWYFTEDKQEDCDDEVLVNEFKKLTTNENTTGGIEMNFNELIDYAVTNGAVVEHNNANSIEPYVIAQLAGNRFSITTVNGTVTFANADIEKRNFDVIIHSSSLDQVFTEYKKWSTSLAFKASKNYEHDRFNEMVAKLREEGRITAIEEVMAKDVAYDMTIGWDEMEIETVEQYHSHQDAFVKALGKGYEAMKADHSDIDSWDIDEVNDISNEYSYGVVEESFSLIIMEKEMGGK